MSVSEEVELVNVTLGEHLLLSCETGAVSPPTLSAWTRNGVEITGNGVGVSHALLRALNH